MLLERNDVNPDATDENGRTPFSWAAGSMFEMTGAGGMCERVVTLQLERNGVYLDRADKSGQTPFSWPAGNGARKIWRWYRN